MNENNTIDNGIEKIDAIRDLIFGQNIEEYDRILKDIKSEMHKIKSEHAANIKEMQKAFNNHLNTLETKLDSKFEAHQTVIDNRLGELGKELEKFEKSTGTNISTLNEKITKTKQELKHSLKETRTDISKDISALEATTVSEDKLSNALIKIGKKLIE